MRPDILLSEFGRVLKREGGVLYPLFVALSTPRHLTHNTDDVGDEDGARERALREEREARVGAAVLPLLWLTCWLKHCCIQTLFECILQSLQLLS